VQTTKRISIQIDLAKETKIPLPTFVQHDTNIIEIIVVENGVAADISTIGRIVANYRRPDKQVISRLLTIEGKKAVYTLGTEEMELAGVGDVEFAFYSTDDVQRVSTNHIRVLINPNIGTDAIYDNDSQLTVLQSVFVEVKTNGDYAKAQGDYAAEKGLAAETAASNANAETANLAQMKADVTAAKDSATTAATHAQTQGDYAKGEADKTAAKLAELEGVNATQINERLNNTDAQLAENVTYENFYRKPKNGKKIVFVGDSTTGSAPAIFTRMGIYTQVGNILEGATIVNKGLSGKTLNSFLTDTGTYGLNTVVGEQASLYVFSYGINDIRAGVDSPGRTVAQITADLKTAIDRLLSETSAYILLRIPNPFLTKNTGQGWVSPNENAQLYSDQLYQIYEGFRGYSNRVDVIDIPSLVFGKKCLDSHPYMLDQLHPNDVGYTAIADEIASRISATNKNVYKNTVLKGAITAIDTAGNTISFTTPSDKTPKINDIVYIGHNSSFPILSEPLNTGANKWRINYNSNIDVSRYGGVTITTDKETSLKTNEDSNLETDWVKAVLAPISTDTATQIELVIDLQSYGFTGLQRIIGNYKYYTEDTRIKKVSQAFWFNNTSDPTVITGGVNADGLAYSVTPEYGKVTAHTSSYDKDFTGYRYLHYLVYLPNITAGQTDLTIEVGNINIEIGGQKLNLSGLAWYHYRGLSQSLITGSTERNVLATYKYAFGLEKRILEPTSNKSRNWMKALITKTGGVPTYVKVAIPISGFNWTASKSFSLSYKYFTKSAIANKVGGMLYFSNDPATITGGINTSFTESNITYSKTTPYTGTVSVNPTGYTYMHLLVKANVTAAGDFKFDLGEVAISADGVAIDLTGLTWSIHAPEAGAKLLTNLYSGDYGLTYREFIEELLLRNLI
jgi:lysophospholipase L1-like esterase